MPQILITKVVKKENIAKDYWLVTLQFENDFDFAAGQYVSLKVDPSGTRRPYSIASPPGGNTIELAVDVSPMGVGSKYILGLKEGDSVEALGPVGNFTLSSKNAKANKLFIATGSGIAPFRSMIFDLLKKHKYQGEISLIWGMRYEEDLFWQEELLQLNKDFANFSYKVILSKPGERWHGEQGHVGDCLRNHFMEKMTDLSQWEFFLCGSQAMIMETGAYLAGKGTAKEDIHFEKFF